MSETFDVRPAIADDLPALARIYVDAAQAARARDPSHFRVPEVDSAVAQFRTSLGRPDTRVFVAERAGEVAGFVEVRLDRPGDRVSMIRPRTVGRVREVAVGTRHRGAGAGTELLTRAEAWARAEGAEDVLLDTHVDNVGGIRFYLERMGYRPLGLVLVKELRRTAQVGATRDPRRSAPASG